MRTRLLGLLACLVIVIVAPEASAETVKRACPSGHTLKCRGEIVRLRAAVRWQRQHAVAAHWPGDAAAAIVLACRREHVSCSGFLNVAACESHLFPLARNGQYLGLFQLSPRHRADPVIVALGWQDPYAEALHTVRYVKAHGWGEWQCRPDGGLRW